MFGHSKNNKTSKSKPKSKSTTKPKAKPSTTKPKSIPTTKPKSIPTTKTKVNPTSKPTAKPTSKLAISKLKGILTTKPKSKTPTKPKTNSKWLKPTAKPKSSTSTSKSTANPQSKSTGLVTKPKVVSTRDGTFFEKISAKMKGKNNIGMTLKTDDKFLSKDKNTKSKSRWVAVIDKNSKDEFAVVNLTSEKKPYSSELKGYFAGNNKTTYFKHFVEIEDDESQPIKVNSKFVPNLSNYDLNQTQVLQINKKLFTEVKNKNKNEAKITKLKNR